MVTVEKAKSKKRGGVRIRRAKATNAQQALLREIIVAAGGPNKVAVLAKEKTGEEAFYDANIINWRNRSGVPLKFCAVLGKILKVPPAALNFKAYSTFAGGSDTWEDIVKKCAPVIGKDRVSYILKRLWR